MENGLPLGAWNPIHIHWLWSCSCWHFLWSSSMLVFQVRNENQHSVSSGNNQGSIFIMMCVTMTGWNRVGIYGVGVWKVHWGGSIANSSRFAKAVKHTTLDLCCILFASVSWCYLCWSFCLQLQFCMLHSAVFSFILVKWAHTFKLFTLWLIVWTHTHGENDK